MSELSTRTPETIAAEINAIKSNVRTIVMASAMEIGRKLEEAKRVVPKGRWTEYLEGLEYSERTAQNLMRLAAEYKDAPQAIADLSVTQAVLLLGVPEEEREAFVESHDMEGMSTRELDAEIKALKAEKAKLQTSMDELVEQNKGLTDEAEAAKTAAKAARADGAKAAEERAAQLLKQLNELEAAQMQAKDGSKEQEAEQLRRELEAARQAQQQARAEADRLQEEIKNATRPAVEVVTPPEVLKELEQLRAQASRSTAETEIRAAYDLLKASFERLVQKLEAAEQNAEGMTMAQKYRAAFGKALSQMAKMMEAEE